jgi:serine/threonine-protein kinase
VGVTEAPDGVRVRAGRASAGLVAATETSQSLPPDVLSEGARRLGWLGLAHAGTTTLAYFAHRGYLAWTTSLELGMGIADVFSAASVLVGLAVFVIVRSGVLTPQQSVNLGLLFQVVGAFGFAGGSISSAPSSVLTAPVSGVPVECVWIVTYPLVVPNTPGKVLLASLLSASMGPAALFLSSAVTGRPIDNVTGFALYYLTSNYLCATFAFVIARIVYRFNIRLKQLRDIGSYELIERIGEGGMGEVWRAKHKLLVRPAAIKLIRPDVLGASQRSRDAILKRFEREARDTAALGSTHTIDVHDFGVTEDGDFYYVMELLEGISLDRYVKTFGPMEPARVVYLLRQVCHSLSEAHGRGLVHRDIKPANLFMCRLGPDDDFVKVLDFGLVKHAQPATTVTALSVEGVTAGTPGYMPPEIALGRPNVDGRADLYSLGCVAYYLLTAEPVFAGDGPLAIALAQVHEAPIPPSLRSEFEIPPALDALILECLAKDPAARPPSAAVLDERLAATVSLGKWTSELAHAWWELHAASLDLERSTRDASGHTWPTPVRFRPRLEGKPTHASVALGRPVKARR